MILYLLKINIKHKFALKIHIKNNKRNTILDLEDDAAHVNMGGAWRIPTKDEFYELISNTTHTETTMYGVQGMMFTSNINGQELFIPFMQGYWYNGNYYKAKSCACIWSSQVYASYTNVAYELYCNSDGYAYVTDFFRSDAFCVRGVFKK